MITQHDLEAIAKRQGKPGNWVLSVYLDVDQSRAVNLNHEFEPALKTMLRSTAQPIHTDAERQNFEEDTARVLSFLAGCKPTGRSMVIFCDKSEDFFWQRNLNVPMRNNVYWDETPHLRPLLEAFDEFERYGVILADRTQGRVFTVFLGEIEEHFETVPATAVKHFKTASSDHIRSQMQFQRKADMHAFWHLKHVTEMMTRLARSYEFDRLILAGPSESTSTLYRLLPNRLQARVVASIPLPIDASLQQVLETTGKIEHEVERSFEVKLVDELIVSAAKQMGAVTGLAATLQALDRNQVWKLVYAEDVAVSGGRCNGCQRLYGDTCLTCGYCNRPLQQVNDLVEQLLERAVGVKGKIEQVREEAAKRLNKVGGIGALLKF